jgi:hypothetical protein
MTLNDAQLLNDIKQDYGLSGKGVSGSAKRKVGRPKKVKQVAKTRKAGRPKGSKNKSKDSDFDIEGSGFGDFLRKAFNVVSMPLKLATLPIKMITGGSAQDKKLYKKMGLTGKGKGVDLIKMLYQIYKNFTSPSVNASPSVGNGVSASGVSASGVTASGVTASGKRKYVKKTVGNGVTASGKRKYVKKTGKGIVKDLVKTAMKVANISPFTDTLSGTPLMKILGKDRVNNFVADFVSSKIPNPFGKGKKKMTFNTRSQLVKHIMNEKGMKLPEASSYVKQHNLWKSKAK